MKRLIALVLCCLLLCSCGIGPGEETAPTQAAPTTPAVAPTEPGGSHHPDSTLEDKTLGAVQLFSMDMPYPHAAVPMGEDVLVFSGELGTTLTRLSGENLFVTAQAHLGQYIHVGDPSVRVDETGISYYQEDTHELVFMDTNLREYRRISLPGDLWGTPVLTENRDKVYYCTAGDVRELELATGICRVVKQIAYPYQSVCNVLSSTLRLELVDDWGQWRSLYISRETGQTVHEGPDNLTVSSSAGDWFTAGVEGAMHTFVYRLGDGPERQLTPKDPEATGLFLETVGYLVTMTMLPDSDVVLQCYDLHTGQRLSELTLEDQYQPWHMAGDPLTGNVYILTDEVAGTRHLLRWQVEKLPTGDTQDYSGPHYTLENPDVEGLLQCRLYAREIGQRHGVEVMTGFDAVQTPPPDYTLVPEYQVPVLMRKLEEMDALLQAFPAEMLKTAVSGTDDGVLRIGIVREIRGITAYDSLNTAGGLCYWEENNVYVLQSVTTELVYTLYHELFHAIETRLLSNSDQCYDWEYLNPQGFSYTYRYSDYVELTHSEYLQDENRYFIDAYSMTFPTEDRARIWEYAMNEGNAHYFQSQAMQQKLRALCAGIREAYGLEDNPEMFLWEQYLSEPMTYVP